MFRVKSRIDTLVVGTRIAMPSNFPFKDYFGLNGSMRTLEEIGGEFNLTKERVRQIKEKALKKLRNERRVNRPPGRSPHGSSLT